MNIVHAADLHLDSPLRGLERYEGAPVERIRGATRRALENLVALCLDEEAALLLLAGDLYDGTWKDYATGLFFTAQMARLRAAGTRVVLVRGNHDAASHITRSLRLPEHVRELDTKRPETVVFDDLGVAVHGQGFATRAVTDDLAVRYPDRIDGLVNIGLLHTSVGGREGHETYAPCKLETLVAKGYDYWALGHVHAREVLARDPWIVFPGNLQGRHAKETGPKGATVVRIADQRVASVEHRALDVVRWTRCEVDVSAARSAGDVGELVAAALRDELAAADGRVLAARVRLTGATEAHHALLADAERTIAEIRAATATASDEAWIERVELATTSPADVDALADRDDALGELVRSVRALRTDDAALTELAHAFDDLARKLPPELREGEDALRPNEPGQLRALLDRVQELVLPIGSDEAAR